MGVKVGSTSCLHWTHPTQTLTSLKRRSFSDQPLTIKNFHNLNQSVSRNHRKSYPVRRSCSASSDSSAFFDEEFSKQLQELAMKFQAPETVSHQESELEMVSNSKSEIISNFESVSLCESNRIFDPLNSPTWPEIVEVERKASSVDLPLSLRMIKRKRQWQEGFVEASGSAYSSVKKAFSNMVFIIRELQSFTIQMRETIMYEDMRGILTRVQTEMHDSFVWLFQQVFSHTPTLMVYVMILLANYSVYSMNAFAAPPPPLAPITATVSISENRQNLIKFDTLKTFPSGKTASVGGNGGGSGNFRPISSGTDGAGRFGSERVILPDVVQEEESISGQELRLWNSMVDEAMEIQFKMRYVVLDHETMMRFVSPVYVEVEHDDYADYVRTEVYYRTGLDEDPVNSLLLVNYAQFLYLVARDYDRAEEYFKRAVKIEPRDAEALNKYASFLWHAKKDVSGAEETYLEAISADPTNSYYASDYAHFLFTTGGDDTCYPIDTHDTCANNA